MEHEREDLETELDWNLFKQKHPNLAHGPLVAGALVFLRGDNLFQTLMLNLLRYDAEQKPMACIGKDRPIWERDDLPKPGAKVPTGYLEYLTWRSRHIRLLPEWGEEGIVVRRLYIAQAESFPQNFQIREQDPMFAYREAKDGGLLPLKLEANRALWRDSASLFEYGAKDTKGSRRRPAAFGQLAQLMHQRKIKERRFFRCFVIGLVNAQANPLLWRMEEMSPPVTLLEDRDQVGELRKALQRAETVGDRLSYCTRVLVEALLTLNRRSPDKKDLEKMENTLRTGPDYWAALEAPFFRFLQNPSEEAERQWTKTLFRTARKAMERGAAQYVASSARELQALEKQIMKVVLQKDGTLKLPQTILDQLHLHPGDALEVILDEKGGVGFTLQTGSILDLQGILPPPEKSVSLEGIDAAIRKRAVEQ